MSGWVLLILGLASLAVVVGMAVWVGLKGWRVAQHGMAATRSAGPLARDVASRATTLEISVSLLQTSAAGLQDNLGRLQASAERLRIVAEALDQAIAPHRGVRSFFGR
jgi:hypothetical protein